MNRDTITLPRSVLEQAISTILELEYSNSTAVSDKMARDSKAALRAALEQPQGEQEPVAWMKTWDSVGHARTGMKRVDLTPECETWLANMFPVITPLYTHPQPPRRPLTDQQIHDCFQHRHRDKATERRMITRSIEFAHGITGEQE